MAALEKRADLVRSKLSTSDEDAAIDHQLTPIEQHLNDCLASLIAGGKSAKYLTNIRQTLRRLFVECRFPVLAEFSRDAVDRWLAAQVKQGMAARTRNIYRGALVTFCNWCVVTGRLISNPFDRVAKADEKCDVRRQRRALTEAELVLLLNVARKRPLLDAMTIHRGKHKGQAKARLRPEVASRLESLDASGP